MSSRFRDAAGVAVLLIALVSAGCDREARKFDPPGPRVDLRDDDLAEIRITEYERNALALASGKRLWTWYNCNGCHANGGGGSGPALLDDVWIYGGDAKSVYKTIAEGRPNGMPAFGERMPKDQLWQLAAYVRSMGALAPKDAAPNRDDAFLTRKPESFMESQKPERPEPAARAGRPQ